MSTVGILHMSMITKAIHIPRQQLLATIAVWALLLAETCLSQSLPPTAGTAPAATAPVDPAQRISNWREDIRFLVQELPKRHPNPFTKISQTEFEKAAADIQQRVGQLDDNAIRLELARLIARIGDPHTVVIPESWGTHVYPFNARVFSDGVF